MHVFGAFYLDAFSSILSPSFRTLRFVWEILRKEKYVCDDPPISKKNVFGGAKGGRIQNKPRTWKQDVKLLFQEWNSELAQVA